MKRCLAAVFLLAACSSPSPVPPPPPEPAGETAETLTDEVRPPEAEAPERLTGLPGIDRAQDLRMRVLDARGVGRLGDAPIPAGQASDLRTGEWLLSEAGSEYEITLRSSLLPDGIIRLEGRSAFLVEEPAKGPLPRFRVFGGHASFYLPDVPVGTLEVWTPAGPLVSHGAVFTVTVAPDAQVLVTCREGQVFLTGAQNAVALPGQVIVADRLGRGRVYAMTPNEALVFAGRWLAIMTEEAGPMVARLLPRRLREWQAARADHDLERQRLAALWFRAAAVSQPSMPGPDLWAGALGPVKASAWTSFPSAGLLGELPE